MILKLALSAEKIGDIYSAVSLYEQYIITNPDDIEIIYKLAENYRGIRDYSKAALYYEKTISLNPGIYKNAYYYLADMYMQQGQYQKALETFNISKKNGVTGDEKFFLNNKIEGCEKALNVKLVNERIRVVHADTSINKINTELSPVFIDEQSMLYSSIKEDELKYYSVKDANPKFPVSKVYMANRIDDSTWVNSEEWTMNDDFYHTGNVAFTLDRKKVYFTKCSRNRENRIICSIYICRRTQTGWTEPKPLNSQINLPGYTSTQVTIGRESKKNREVIYFVSDRPGGRGGFDIWYTVYDYTNNSYSPPANVGSSINSRGNEITPHCDLRSGILYFSSDFYPGYGGFDIFYSYGELKKWTNAENIGKNTNSSSDDLYYSINPYKRNEGFFVSNRSGSASKMHETCCDDIYYFLKEKVDKIFIKGKVFESEIKDSSMISSDLLSSLVNNENKNVIIDSSMASLIRENYNYENENNKKNALSRVAVSVYITNADNEDILIYTDSTDENGNYFHELQPLKDYKIVFNKDEYFNKNINVSTKIIGWNDTISMNDVEIQKIPRKPIQFAVYYETNSDELQDVSKEKIDTTILTILLESPDLVVEISSHTDSIGDNDYNQKLSQRRAESVVKYLIENGINKSRLIAFGYGELNPVADNQTEEGRNLNRRSELKIVGSKDEFSKLNVPELIITKPHPNREEIIKKMKPIDYE